MRARRIYRGLEGAGAALALPALSNAAAFEAAVGTAASVHSGFKR